MRNRDEHLAWARQRALAILQQQRLERRAVAQALASLASDLNKHDDTRDHPCVMALMAGVLAGAPPSRAELARLIAQVE